MKKQITVDITELVEEIVQELHAECKGKTSINEYEKWRQMLAKVANEKYWTTFALRKDTAEPWLWQNSFYYHNPNE